MKKVLTSLLVFMFAFLVFSVSQVSAKVITNKNGAVTVAKNEVVNDDLFIGGQTVDIAGTVNGDVFVGAQTVKITGIINGNLHVGANTLDLGGNVKGNVYAGGQNILVSESTIGGSLLVGGATVNVDKATTVGGSILAGSGNLTIDSQVKRSVYAGAGTLTLGADAKIGKDFYYGSGNNQANISSSAKILGSTYKSENKQNGVSVNNAKKEIPAILNGVRLAGTLISFIGALIVGFIYLKLFGKHLTETADLVSCCFWKSLGVGFLVTIALVPGLIVLLITVIGIPLAGLSLLVFLLYSYLAKIIVGLAFGTWISRKMKWKVATYAAFAFGLLVIFLLKLIPIVGFITSVAVFWSGLGALTLRIFSKSK